MRYDLFSVSGVKMIDGASREARGCEKEEVEIVRSIEPAQRQESEKTWIACNKIDSKEEALRSLVIPLLFQSMKFPVVVLRKQRFELFR